MRVPSVYDLFLICLAIAVAILASYAAWNVARQRLLTARQRRSEDMLESSEDKFRVLVEAVKDYAIFMIDPRGFVTTWNSGAERITGYSDQEMIGRHVSTLYTPEDAIADATSVELKIAREKGHFEGEAIRVRKNGEKFWSHIVIDPLYDKSGRLYGFSKVTRDVTALKAAEEKTRSLNEELERRVRERTLALQERERQLRTITNALPVLIAQADAEERILFANGSFCDWFDKDPREIGRLTFREVLGEDRYAANKVFIDRVLAGETVSYERGSYSGDRHAILNITFVPEFDAHQRTKGFIIVASDVTRYKAIESELKNAKEEAEVANETKSAFLANMSHEIRTPLGAVIGFSELLMDDDMSPSERMNMIEIIKRNGKLLSTIINDILDLSKVEAGKLEIERTDVLLGDLLKEISAYLNLEAMGKGIRLTISVEGAIPPVIKTDSIRLRQILFNIIGNAIKFTEKGSVQVKARLAADPSKIAFSVTDTGTGIPAEHATRLFAPFMQADVTTTRKFGGTGLGLVLSKKLANALGGDVVLENSEPGRGSTFLVTIDHGQAADSFHEMPAAAAAAEQSVMAGYGSELSSHRILVIDDSPDNLALIKRILRLSGAAVETASNGREGLEKALDGDFNIVLMDLQMPEMDGYEATKELRRKGFRPPIIALTAHAMKEERKRCLDGGFNEHLTKPVDRAALIQVLRDFSDA